VSGWKESVKLLSIQRDQTYSLEILIFHNDSNCLAAKKQKSVYESHVADRIIKATIEPGWLKRVHTWLQCHSQRG
jgi:hypothetical protein